MILLELHLRNMEKMVKLLSLQLPFVKSKSGIYQTRCSCVDLLNTMQMKML